MLDLTSSCTPPIARRSTPLTMPSNAGSRARISTPADGLLTRPGTGISAHRRDRRARTYRHAESRQPCLGGHTGTARIARSVMLTAADASSEPGSSSPVWVAQGLPLVGIGWRWSVGRSRTGRRCLPTTARPRTVRPPPRGCRRPRRSVRGGDGRRGGRGARRPSCGGRRSRQPAGRWWRRLGRPQ